jgi:transposase
VIGVYVGKDTFHLVGFDRSGKRVLRLKIRRLAFPQVFGKPPR